MAVRHDYAVHASDGDACRFRNFPAFSQLNGSTSVSPMTSDIMTIKEVAEYLKITQKTAYRLAAEGKLPGFKVGGSWRFRRADLSDWIGQQAERAAPNDRKPETGG